MRSSGSTPSRPERPIALGLIVVGDDHPRACTGRRLIRGGIAREVPWPGGRRTASVLLDPYATIPLTAGDRPRAEDAGLVAVDCSWNRLSRAHARGVPNIRDRGGGGARRLPMLLAANPQHFGRLGELNTAEALAAALWILGRPEESAGLLSGFAGGSTFLELNAERLARYAAAGSAEAMLAEERELFGGGRLTPTSGAARWEDGVAPRPSRR